MPSLRRQMTPDRCSTIQARCRRASRRQPQRDRRCRRQAPVGQNRRVLQTGPNALSTRDGAPIDRPGGDAVATVYLLERCLRQAARTARIVTAQGSGASVCAPLSSNGCTCTDCAPACTAASASAAICARVCGAAGCMRSPFRAACRNGLDDRGCVIRSALVHLSVAASLQDEQADRIGDAADDAELAVHTRIAGTADRDQGAQHRGDTDHDRGNGRSVPI